MPVTPWRIAGSGTTKPLDNPPVGPEPILWENPGLVIAEDNFTANAQSDVTAFQFGDVTNGLVGRDFGFKTLGLPPDDQVRGIELRAKITLFSPTNLEAQDETIRAILNGKEKGENLAKTTFWPVGFPLTFVTWGDVNQNYNWQDPTIPTVSDLDFFFGWMISAETFLVDQKSDGDGQLSVDVMEMRIRHEPPPTRRRITVFHH